MGWFMSQKSKLLMVFREELLKGKLGEVVRDWPLHNWTQWEAYLRVRAQDLRQQPLVPSQAGVSELVQI